MVSKIRQQWWKQLITSRQSTSTCIICQGQVSSSLNNLLNNNSVICKGCFNRMNPRIKSINVNNVRGYTLVTYNEFNKNLILQIKARYDLALAKEILRPFKTVIREQFKGYYLAHVPSTAKSDKVRGFNHVKMIFDAIDLPQIDLFEKSRNYKQASTSFKKRSAAAAAIKLKPNLVIPSKILVVDDIITSGASLNACLGLLKQHKVKHLRFLVFANNCRKIRQNRNQISTKF